MEKKLRNRALSVSVAGLAAAICVVLPAGSAQAATAIEPAAAAAAVPKWCGHDERWVPVGDWLYKFDFHANEGSRHIHYYQYQHRFNTVIHGTDSARC